MKSQLERADRGPLGRVVPERGEIGGLLSGGAGLLLLALSALGCQPTEVPRQTGCQSCHRGADGAGHGLEIPHARFALMCVECHGGDPAATTLEGAHVANPQLIEVVEDLSADELGKLDQDYLKFLNPAHPAVVNRSCGSLGPQAAAGAGCHQAIIDTMQLSVHATGVGLANIPRFEAGVLPGRPPTRAMVQTVNPTFQSSTAPRFTYAGLDGLRLARLEAATPADPRPYLDHFLTKQCGTCHLNVYGGGTTAGRDGLYRGVGCAACHMPYGRDGLSRTGDPNVDKASPAHVETHELVRAPPQRACEACHNRSNRIGLQYKGWREVTEAEQGNLQRVTANTAVEFGRPAGTFLLDEDTRNAVDETPPDVHQVAGMTCVDCHVGVDVHGDGHVRASMAAETGVECADCHGTFEARAAPVEGAFRSTGGSRLERLEVGADGGLVLTLVSGEVRPVTQLVDLTAPAELGAHDPQHAGLECYACHTTWMQNVLRMDRVLDLRGRAVDPLEGLDTPGLTSEHLMETTLDALLLGVNVDGMISPFMAEHGPLTVIEACTSSCTVDVGSATPGRKVVDGWLGQSSEGRIGLSFRPVVPHTVGGAAAVRPCAGCHPQAGGGNLAAVRAVYGFGTGEHLYTEPASGRTVDLLRMVDDTGTSTSALGTLLARPIEPERVARALAAQVP
jgi:hypothetical protein